MLSQNSKAHSGTEKAVVALPLPFPVSQEEGFGVGVVSDPQKPGQAVFWNGGPQKFGQAAPLPSPFRLLAPFHRNH